MNIAALFVLGLLIGWLVEWAIDWFYWRGRIHNVTNENAGLKERIILLEAKKNKKSQAAKTRPISDRAGKDNLQAIKGIGPVISKRLNEAGIYTFEELSQLTADELEEILGSLIKRFFPGEDRILTQAKEFAQKKAQKS